jgi:UDP-N-acetylmuramyl pentapeptide synthase
MENIFETETEAIDFLKKDGKVVYNGDNIYLKRLKNKNINSFTFGFEKDNELRVEKIKDNFYFNYKAKKIPVKLKNDAEHNYLNAAAAFLVSVLCKIETKKILERLAKFKGVKMRMQEFKLNKNKIIFDAYNANPQSMHSAIESLKKKEPKILILGDMKELGKYSLKYHRELGKYLLKTKFDMAYLIGKEIKETYKVLKDKKENVKYFLSADLAQSEINRILKDKSGFYVLFKASRSMHFENLLDKYGQKKVH